MIVRVSKPTLLDHLQSGHQVIEASAGTGKTFTLERLVADLVLSGTPLERVLVVTYTEKATQELLTRVRSFLQKLANQCEDDVEAPFWEVGDEERVLLGTALRSFERATISTIHGFCRQVLQESALEGRTLFDRELVDERALFGRAFRHALAHTFTQDPNFGLILETSLANGDSIENLEGELWNVHNDGGRLRPALDLWTAWVRDFDPALLEGVPPLIQAWKNAKVTCKAAVNRLDVICPKLALAQNEFQVAQAFNIDDLQDLWKAVNNLPSQPGAHTPLHNWLLRGIDCALSPATFRAHLFLPIVQSTLHQMAQDQGLFTFSSMIRGVVEALEGPEGEALAQRLRDRYDVALVDEFQDTDPLQWRIFQRIFLREDRRLILIGDPKQAIYGFRGGDLPTYQEACRETLGTNPPQRLERNYRSTPEVINAYNYILSGNGPTSFFEDGSLYPQEVACGCTERKALVGSESIKPVDVFVLDSTKGGQALWRRLARQVAQRIQHTVTSGIRFGDPDTMRTLGYGDVQVLVGKATEGELMAKALRDQGIPCAFYKQKGLFQTRETQEWLDVLRAVEDPRNRSLQLRAFLSAFFGYDIEDSRRLPGLLEEHPALQRLLAWNALAQQHRFGEMLDAMLEEGGLVRRLLLCETGYRSLVNYRHISEALLNVAAQRRVTLQDLIRQLDRWQQGVEKPPVEDGELQRLEGDKNAVQILTLHSAKGLEAPIVAIFAYGKPRASTLRRFHEGLERCLCLGQAPDAMVNKAKDEARAENQRLLYVGLTRAQAKLILCAFEKDGEAANLQSAYDALNPRLVALQGQREDLFTWERVENLVNTPLEVSSPQLTQTDCLPTIPEAQNTWDYQALAKAARPFLTTSFSALQDRIEAEEALLRGDRDQPGIRPAPGDLPKGTQSGRVMHELLEWAPLETLGTLGEWSQRPEVRAKIQETLQFHGLPLSLEAKAAEGVHAGLTCDLPLAWGGVLRIDRAQRVLRETQFLARFLEAERFPSEHDLLKGSIDVLCENDGRLYILDWKNSLLPDYEWATLQAAVDQHYLLQAQVYLQATLACFHIQDEAAYEAKFGGILYVFLRGLPTKGTWSIRPTWAEVQTWKHALERIHHEVALA